MTVVGIVTSIFGAILNLSLYAFTSSLPAATELASAKIRYVPAPSADSDETTNAFVSVADSVASLGLPSWPKLILAYS